MKRFVFTLQSLLNVKLSVEKQYMAELGICEQRIQAFMKEKDTLVFRLNMKKTEFAQECKSGVKPSDLATYSIGFKTLRDKILTQEEKIQMAEDEKARVQKKLVEVMGERKMLENLKEKQREEHKVQQRAEDAAAIDDFLSNKVTME